MIAMQLTFVATAQVNYEAEVNELVSETTFDLKNNILVFWEKYTPDPRGGFYGTVLNDGTPVPEAPKGCVLNARILWTFSKAYHVFHEDKYKVLADRASQYFIGHCIDREYGGAYWVLDADGTARDTDKQTYGIAYGIYGLAGHYEATGNRESLDKAIELYQALEQYAYDDENGGYIESFNYKWELPQRFGYDGDGVAPKTMNTHLHVLEAYTLLYKVWPDSVLKVRLEELVDIFMNKIIDRQSWHQHLFLTIDWQNLEDIDSYGHDFELSWLLVEAAQVLNNQDLIKQIETIALKLVDTQMEEGWNSDGYTYYEKEDGHIKGGIDWWPQAETVVAYYNAWQISGQSKYLFAAVRTWEWIKNNLVDYQYGGWYSGVDENLKPQKERPKANMWKCPYHNSRMGFELILRTRE
jgi:mannobiose 2-epimerase